jgi:hypothetical protein
MEIKNFNAGNGEIWMVNVHNEVYRRAGVNMAEYNPGAVWEQVYGEHSMVTTAEEGVVWAIDAHGQTWRWNSGEISLEEIIDNTDHDWTWIDPEQLTRVDVGYNSQVVGIDTAGSAKWRVGVT